jgi:voltage-gated potassium channel
MSDTANATNARIERERRSLLRRVSRLLDTPMTVLSFVWLALLVIEFTYGLHPTLDGIGLIMWGLFALHFVLEFWIAPRKIEYLKTNWLTALALVLPAFRVLRVFRGLRMFRGLALLRTARVGRGIRLVRWLTSLNRGIKATQRTMARRGFYYVLALTAVVAFVGAAGAYRFESPEALAEAGIASESFGPGIRSYGEALWWTSMMLTTMGSDYFPKSTEGRIIALLLAIYAFAIFGYITATVASLLVRVDESQKPSDAALVKELAVLRDDIRRLSDASAPTSNK